MKRGSKDTLPTLVICASASFYEPAVQVEAELRQLGFDVLMPHTAELMKQSGNFDVAPHKPWHTNGGRGYEKKAELMRGHFAKVKAADSVLVLNYAKHGVPNYIGGNVLMELALAFHLGKPIFLLNDLPEESPFLEEILGLLPIPLKGNLQKLQKHLAS